MTLFHPREGLSGAPIGLWIFKKQLRVRASGRRIALDDEDYIPSRASILRIQVLIEKVRDEFPTLITNQVRKKDNKEFVTEK